jgi:hypothetical protein
MKYSRLVLEETESGLKYLEEDLPHDRRKTKPVVHAGPGIFFVYYDSEKKEEGKNFLYDEAIKIIAKKVTRYNRLLTALFKAKI